ncbi:Flp family type IVb pilin [Gemmobacter denitrificans]|uniref:Flp pilus assembly pilin Flp n=1 Tax=Gemmobacter denitrificans TaxID=3123040 RepID=A0ABU8BYC0_9RHOB
MRSFRNFWRDETGAITVDWVVLTAVVIVMVAGVFVVIQQSVFEDTAGRIGDMITSFF